jgi:putative glutamine amidotransferase
MLGTTSISTNSLHHQCIGALGQGLKVSASTPDGVPEAIEGISSEAFLLGLQGHPETLCTEILPAWDACFAGLIAAASQWRTAE